MQAIVQTARSVVRNANRNVCVIVALTAYTLLACTSATAQADAAEPAPFERSQRATDTFQRCLGGPGVPTANDYASIEKALVQIHDKVGLDLFALAPEKYTQWLSRVEPFGPTSYGVAAHETSHFVNSIVRACRPEVTGYYFFGDVFFIDTRPLETAHYSKIAGLLPPQLRSLEQSFRYEHYILKSRQHRGNDLRILLDEWLSSIAGASADWLAYAAQPTEPGGQVEEVFIDTDMVGAQEFTAFVALYLTDFKVTDPAGYQRVICTSDGEALLRHAWHRLQQVQMALRHMQSKTTNPRLRQTPQELAAFLAADQTQLLFARPCSPQP